VPGRAKMPRTIKRSPEKAKRTYEETLEHAEKTYGRGEASHRVAYAALKHSFEKVGDHWEPKQKRGPSDPRSKEPTREAIAGKGESFGGLDYYGHTKDDLSKRAKELGVRGASKMTKRELAEAINKKQ
jgi:cation transport regulator ChaB